MELMYHSLIFDNGIKKINTWKDWHMVPTERPEFVLPEPKFNFMEIAAMDGAIDTTDYVAGRTIFGQRKSTLEFMLENSKRNWMKRRNEIANFLHGRKMKVYLEDEPEYYYQGRFTIDPYKQSYNRSIMTLRYILDPYKYAAKTSNEDWEWDPFNFEDGFIMQAAFKDIKVNSDNYVQMDPEWVKEIGRMPVVPVITVNAPDGIDVKIMNPDIGGHTATRTIMSGVHEYNDIILSENCRIYLEGEGTISFDFRKGIL